ncbi:expressed unknown protein [Seminavis robusta]|uniref:Uncharacterized protein n=1 Tax=Seminavis robusta TaxID=568900 RepID=A0A9N8H2M1_9STRA|nr:expressed unknown protein [Seminavis robusta]|eukprot:Sro21_g014640.1 n/a (336) ;mRNA; f:64335-65342
MQDVRQLSRLRSACSKSSQNHSTTNNNNEHNLYPTKQLKILFKKITLTLLAIVTPCNSLAAAQTQEGQEGQSPASEPFTCEAANECRDCASNGCTWTKGACQDHCEDMFDLRCYSTETHPFWANIIDYMCEVADKDEENWATCGSKQDCATCTYTMIHEAVDEGYEHPCYWHLEDLAGTGSCKPTSVDEVGGTIGADTCLERCFLGGTYSCASCLDMGCSWTGDLCIPSCNSDYLDDINCYSQSSHDNLQEGNGTMIDKICTLAEVEYGDRNVCSVQTDCHECLETYKHGGDTCQWYTDDVTGWGWCGTGECDSFGNCGTTTCQHGGVRGSSKTP